MNVKNLFGEKTVIITIALLLVVVLSAGIFGIEYASVVDDKNEINSQLQQIKQENAKLKAENSSKDVKTQEEIDKNNQLNSKISQLEKEIEEIKLTKANGKGSNKNNNKPNTVITTEKIDMSLLTKPNTGSKVCYLTFDDGPSENTLKILDVLKKANAKASFFVISTSKLAYVKRIHAEGHTVALHSNSHNYGKIYSSENAYFNDLNTISNKVKGQIGIEPKIMRFPGGSSNLVSKSYNKGIMTRLTKQVSSKGYVYVDWNVDSGDASGACVAKNKLVRNIQTYSKNKGNICVLMHDTSAKTTTPQALPEIICYLRGKGYRFEALTTSSPVFHHGVNN